MKKIHKMNQWKLSLVVVSAMFNSCMAPDSGFSGGSGRAGAVKPTPSKTDDVSKVDPPTIPNVPTVPLPPACTEAKLDSARSLTSYVDQVGSDVSVKLELNFIPCPSQVGVVKLPIMFDVDVDSMVTDGQPPKPSYEVYVDGKRTTGPGFLTQMIGNDLFGKMGQDRSYFQSEGSMPASPTLSRAQLTINFRNVRAVHYATDPTSASRNFTVPLFVKVGSAPPVRVNITFSPYAEPA